MPVYPGAPKIIVRARTHHPADASTRHPATAGARVAVAHESAPSLDGAIPYPRSGSAELIAACGGLMLSLGALPLRHQSAYPRKRAWDNAVARLDAEARC
jgi:hypothetical protein